ncbi:hypothetical protein MHU86_17624 [Fragilaria crotonensis]|nr:hypothetical protein MHU86_17624 [Fragilaria crotonensis]
MELARARRRVHYLRKCLSAFRTTFDCSSVIQAYREDLPTDEIPRNTSHCSRLLRWANKEVCRIVKDSYVTRNMERRQKIEELEKSILKVDKVTAQRLRRLKKAEDIKAVTEKLRHVRGKTNRGGVVRLEIPLHDGDDPKTCTQWTQVDIPSEIVRHLQERNRKHFGQAHGTPFTIPPLSTLLGYTGTSVTQQQILLGTFDSSGYDENVKLLLQHLQYAHHTFVDKTRPTISDDDFCDKLKIWSESTTTSPSGMHLGHYKALIARHNYSSDAADDELTPEFKARRDELNSKQQALRRLRLTLMNYSLERGYSFQRWKKWLILYYSRTLTMCACIVPGSFIYMKRTSTCFSV